MMLLYMMTVSYTHLDFAYPINDLLKGYYVVINVESDAAAIAEFERLSKLNKNVIRHLVIAK